MNVLVVDDLANLRYDLIVILNELNFTEITECHDGKHALETIIEREDQFKSPFNLILSDINMPNMTGIDLLKKVRNLEKYSKTPFILISTENEKNIIINAIALGATDYMIKPYTKDYAIKKLTKYL